MPWTNQAVTLIVLEESATGFTGLFAYSPVPGHGNLVASIAAAAGTDPFNNHYVAGLAAYGPNGQVIQLNDTAGTTALNFISGALSEVSPTQMTNTITNRATNDEQVTFRLFGPLSTSSSNDRIEFFITDSTINTPELAALFVNYLTGSTPIALLVGNAFGLDLPVCTTVAAALPGSSGASLTGESWHILPLNAGFAAGTVGPQYQIEPVNGGRVRLRGGVVLTANHPATAFATLPVGYRALNGPYAFVTPNNLSGFTISNGTVVVNGGSTGTLTMQSSGTSGNAFFLDGITFPLD